jgi:hypothetical protein
MRCNLFLGASKTAGPSSINCQGETVLFIGSTLTCPRRVTARMNDG